MLVQSGRNVDLGNSGGIGNLLNTKSQSTGAGITIEAGLGSSLMLNYANFAVQYLDPAPDGSNPFAEPVQGFNGTTDAFNYFSGLSPANQEILLNRVFFGLQHDSGREHTGVTGNTIRGGESVDTVAQDSLIYTNYQRAIHRHREVLWRRWRRQRARAAARPAAKTQRGPAHLQHQQPLPGAGRRRAH